MFSSRHEKAVGDSGRNVEHISRRKWMSFATVESSPNILTGAAAGSLANHRSSQLQHAFAALHHHDVNDVIVLFRQTVRIAIQESKPVVAVIGQRLA